MQKIDSVVGPFCRISYEDLNLNSHDQVKKYLLSEGWIPTQFNRVWDKDNREWRVTSPKLTEDSFGSIQGDFGKLIARRNVVKHRRRTILNYDDPENKGILSHIRGDGRVPAEGITCRTNTARTAHRNAVCNVPKAKENIPYSIAMRSLFCVREPWIMLGADLDQIEARITAHYAALYDGGAYWDVLQNAGDIHKYNAELIKSDRDTAKSFQYAIFYGAKAPKLARIIGCSQREAERHIASFWEGNKGVHLLVKGLEEYYKEYGFIRGLDGRKLFIRAKYKLLNSLIQSAAAIVFKKWGNICNEELRRSNVSCRQIISYHDEFAYRCNPHHKERAIKIIGESAVKAGEYYKMFTPITAEVKSGMNWADVH